MAGTVGVSVPPGQLTFLPPPETLLVRISHVNRTVHRIALPLC
jgi:hypothetical protein